MRSISIDGRKVGPEHDPYIIAEMSANHNGSLERAKQIIDKAAEAGADAIKLQTYTPDTMTLDCNLPDFMISGDDTPWDGRQLYELYEEAQTPWDWHAELFAHARKAGITCFSSPFDHTAIDLLEELGAPAYKIASFENNWPALIARAAKTGKPVIISSGASDLGILETAVRTARQNGCEDLILLKCTSSYPADASSANILTIPHMAQLFDCQVGISDHTLGIGVPVAAVALGATVIEKHFTLNVQDGGVDSSFSLDPAGLALLKGESRRAQAALGHIQYGVSAKEEAVAGYKRSVYFVRDIAAGTVITADDVRVIRPGHGLPPADIDTLIGMTTTCDITRGTAASWHHVRQV